MTDGDVKIQSFSQKNLSEFESSDLMSFKVSNNSEEQPFHCSGTKSKLVSMKTRRCYFKPEDDERLKKIITEIGTEDWKEVAQRMRNKTVRQCRDRYQNYLSPKLNHSEWTPEEDQLLIEQFRKNGPQWAYIKTFFHNRSGVSIKNRWSRLQMQADEKVSEAGVHAPEISMPANPIIAQESQDNQITPEVVAAKKDLVFPIIFPREDFSWVFEW